jgi:hypothetical protein
VDLLVPAFGAELGQRYDDGINRQSHLPALYNNVFRCPHDGIAPWIRWRHWQFPRPVTSRPYSRPPKVPTSKLPERGTTLPRLAA